jgi:hypothetical protein
MKAVVAGSRSRSCAETALILSYLLIVTYYIEIKVACLMTAALFCGKTCK